MKDCESIDVEGNVSKRQDILKQMNDVENRYFSSFQGIKANTFAYRKLLVEDFKMYRLLKNTETNMAKRLQSQETILTALKEEQVLFFYMIWCNKNDTKQYYGIVPDLAQPEEEARKRVEDADNIFQSILKISWVSPELTEAGNDEKMQVLSKIRKYNYMSMLEGVPGVTSSQARTAYSDELMNGMNGEDYGFLYLGRPLSNLDLADLEDQFGNAQKLISTEGSKAIVTQSASSRSCSLQLSTANVCTNSNSQTITKGISFIDFLEDAVATKKEIESFLPPAAFSNFPGFKFNDSATLLEDLDAAAKAAKGTDNEENITFKGVSKSEAETLTFNKTHTNNKQVSNNNGNTKTKTYIITQKEENDAVNEWQKYINQVLRGRTSYSFAMSGYLTNVILLSNAKPSLKKMETLLRCLYCGDNGMRIPIKTWKLEDNADIKEAICRLQIPEYKRVGECGVIPFSESERMARSTFSQLAREDKIAGGYFVSCKEFGQMTAPSYKES